MKLISRCSTILFTSIIFLTSCRKENPIRSTIALIHQPVVPPPPAQPMPSAQQDSLSGREFIFYDLVWAYDVDGAANLYIGVENKPELFGNNERPIQVWIKPGSDSMWIAIERFHYPNSSEYVFSVYSNSLFLFHNPHIFPWSSDTHLAGTKARVKVKFL
jgi:hypothetical protein